jgi:hypothetical protein
MKNKINPRITRVDELIKKVKGIVIRMFFEPLKITVWV